MSREGDMAVVVTPGFGLVLWPDGDPDAPGHAAGVQIAVLVHDATRA